MIELIKSNKEKLTFTEPVGGGLPGEDGGYYTPIVDDEGNLTWVASKEDMPEVESANIKGPTGDSGVYVGSGDMPEDCNIQIDPTGEAVELATTEYVNAAIGDIDTALDSIVAIQEELIGGATE